MITRLEIENDLKSLKEKITCYLGTHITSSVDDIFFKDKLGRIMREINKK